MKTRIATLLLCLSLTALGALAHGGEEHVMGTVTQVTSTSITVKTKAKAPVTVAVAPTSKFIANKAPAKMSDLHVGDRVVIHAVEGADEKLVADTVEFAPGKSGPAAAPATK